MAWLDSSERKALKQASKIMGDLSQADALLEGNIPSKAVELPVVRPYKNIIYSCGNLTVIFDDGTVLDKMNVDKDFLSDIRACKSQKEIENLMVDRTQSTSQKSSHVIETEDERQKVYCNLEVLHKHKDFVVSGNTVILKGVNLPIPTIILTSFIEILEKLEESRKAGKLFGLSSHDYFDQYQALKMFWLKLALNPLPQSREDLLAFCRINDVRITNNGNLILYRRVVSNITADKGYVTFISQSYYSIKSKNQDCKNYAVGKKSGYFYTTDLRKDDFVASELIGNLQHLYLELPEYENNTFTAAHDHTVKIKIGGIYKIDDKKINLDNGLCAAGGLHAAAVDYNYSGFGDTPVVVLVNPSKAITVPTNETGKLRTTEMFVACINDKDQGYHFDESALTSFDEEYHDFSLYELEQAASSKSFSTLSVKDNVPAISLVDLDLIKFMLKNRIKDF